MSKGSINVAVENIFPLIKKFLYSDHEIFLRELVSNATDATLKLKHLVGIGEAKIDFGNPIIEIKINKDKKTLHIIDQGIGMSEEEVKKYINEIAFSGAEEFLEKYKDDSKQSGIIGHFGLGFYASFMVASKVEIFTKSYSDAPAVRWECDGSPEYTIEPTDKKERGTEIVLHIAEDSLDFLEDAKVSDLLVKYNKFMPIPIKFGTKTETKKVEGDDASDEFVADKADDAGVDGNDEKKAKAKSEKKDTPPETIEVDNIINNPTPAWTKLPTELKDEDYAAFYRELYPMQFEEPLFNIHLNVDYPFNLTGILFFPKLQQNLNVQKDKIQLYQNQVYVTDNVEGIVPEFLTLLRGVIDSPDIPLNVSRSYLQADGNVKKISSYISKKVAEKLTSLFKNDRKAFEEKWEDIKIVIEYGMVSDEKFFEKAESFALYPNISKANEEKKYFTYEELENKIKDSQTDKDGKLIILYATDKDAQHSYIVDAQEKGYEVLLFDSPIILHLVQKFETSKENVSFVRVDADHIDKLIKKGDELTSKLSDEEKETLKGVIEKIVPKEQFVVQLESIDSAQPAFKITQPEFMRRMKDMQATGGGGMFGLGNMPDIFNLVVNVNHSLVDRILALKDEPEQQALIKQGVDLAKLSKGLLKGEEMTSFVKRSFEMLDKASKPVKDSVKENTKKQAKEQVKDKNQDKAQKQASDKTKSQTKTK